MGGLVSCLVLRDVMRYATFIRDILALTEHQRLVSSMMLYNISDNNEQLIISSIARA